jgi:hypothetical protein
MLREHNIVDSCHLNYPAAEKQTYHIWIDTYKNIGHTWYYSHEGEWHFF